MCKQRSKYSLPSENIAQRQSDIMEHKIAVLASLMSFTQARVIGLEGVSIEKMTP